MGILSGQRILITAGPTYEAIDPVRFLGNRSSGRLGYELARAARQRGAHVTLISGPTTLARPRSIRFIPVVSAREMARACRAYAPHADIIIMSAAVADYRPARVARHKLKKGIRRCTLDLVPNPDILATLCRRRRPGQIIVGFALESRHLITQAQRKLRRKGCDLIVANHTVALGAVAQRATIILPNTPPFNLPITTKAILARRLLEIIAGLTPRP